MKSTQKLKIATLLSFLIIVFPGSHVTLINLFILVIDFFQFFFMIGIEPIDVYAIKSLFLSGLTILSLILIFKKSRLLTLACVFMQYLWLICACNKNNLDNIYYLSTMGLYLLLSLLLILYLFKKQEHNTNATNL